MVYESIFQATLFYRASYSLFIYLFVFFIFGFYFLISAFIALTYIVGAQLVIPIWMTTNEANTEKETELVTAKVKISKCLT